MKNIVLTEEQFKSFLRNAFIQGEKYQENWALEQIGDIDEITEQDFGEWYYNLDLTEFENKNMKKKLIRNGVFETNSSSCHSISIDKNNKNFTASSLYVDEDGCVTLTGGEFGWEQEEYFDALTKANYCAQDIYRYDWSSDSYSLDEYKKNMLIDVIKEQTGCTDVLFDIQSLKDGYIDHESHGTSYEAFQNKEILRNFIFNRNSYLETDNDNH